MNIDITLKNYRCFQDTSPARITLRKGFTGFVGINNSGKSSLLRFFHDFRPLLGSIAQQHVIIEGLKGRHGKLDLYSISDADELFCNANTRDLEIDFCFSGLEGSPSHIVPKNLNIVILREGKTWFPRVIMSDGTKIENNEALSYTEDHKLVVAGRVTGKLDDIFPALDKLKETLYIGPFRNILSLGASPPYFDIQVGHSFIQLWRNYKAGDIKRNRKTFYDLTQSIKHIFGYRDLEINASEKDDALHIFINGEPYKLQEIGSGIAQFILVLANAAIKQPAFILIDEPELNLHPSLQLDFLTTLASYASEGILFSTHSIGLARASADRIYSVRKIDEGKSEVMPYESTPRLSELIGELSFSGYKELGFDKILLVEGRTDVKTIQQLLRLLKKDHQILVIPLGGSDLINGISEDELREVTRISENVHALIDSERDTPNALLEIERQAFLEICQRIRINCHVLERRATENYLSDEAVKKIKGDGYQALGHFEKLKTARRAWAKSENWRIAREMNLDELMLTDLGSFLYSI